MIEVSAKNLEIDGSGSFNDAAPLEIDGKLYLVTEFYYYPQKLEQQYWNGVHAQDGKLIIDTDGFLMLPDKHLCTIDLPVKAQVDLANLMPNPIFQHRKLAEDDKGKALTSKEWKIKPGLKLIEQTLLD